MNEVKLTQEKYNQLVDAAEKVVKQQDTISKLVRAVNTLTLRTEAVEKKLSLLQTDNWGDLYTAGPFGK